MELKEFIEETLIQIVDCIESAQETCLKKGAVISPSYYDSDNNNATEYDGIKRRINDVIFEIALTVSDSKDGKSVIGIWFGGIGLGSQEKSEARNISITNVKFSVPVAFPCVNTKSLKGRGIKKFSY